jgi:hypothetical protein
MLTIYTITYNEELMIEFFINHYREKFPNCKIVIYDNYSTDNTVNIAKKYNCDIKYFDSNNQISETKYLEIKNNCWKESTTDWVIVCDCDELVNISQDKLKIEELKGSTIINFEGYDMINLSKDIDLYKIKNGVRNKMYDKRILFNKKNINEINYEAGCHTCNPIGDVLYSKEVYKLFHYKYLSEDYLISRYKLFSSRLSEENKKNKWGTHYIKQENEIRNNFKDLKNKSQIVHE